MSVERLWVLLQDNGRCKIFWRMSRWCDSLYTCTMISTSLRSQQSTSKEYHCFKSNKKRKVWNQCNNFCLVRLYASNILEVYRNLFLCTVFYTKILKSCGELENKDFMLFSFRDLYIVFYNNFLLKELVFSIFSIFLTCRLICAHWDLASMQWGHQNQKLILWIFTKQFMYKCFYFYRGSCFLEILLFVAHSYTYQIVIRIKFIRTHLWLIVFIALPPDFLYNRFLNFFCVQRIGIKRFRPFEPIERVSQDQGTFFCDIFLLVVSIYYEPKCNAYF